MGIARGGVAERRDVVGIAAFAPLRCGRREKSEDTKRQTISEGAGKGGVIPHFSSCKQRNRKPCLPCGFMHCCDRMKAINLNLTRYL